MNTLVTDDFAERPSGTPVTFTYSDGSTTTHNTSFVGFVRLEDVPEGPIRTQAWVGRPIPELTPGDLEGRLE